MTKRKKTQTAHVWRLMCSLQVFGFKMWMLTAIYATKICKGKNIIKNKVIYWSVSTLSTTKFGTVVQEMSSRCMLSVQWTNTKKKKNTFKAWFFFFIKQTYSTCFASFGSFGINNNSGSLGTNKTSFLLRSSYSQLCSDSLLSPYSAAGGHDSHASIRRYWSFGHKLFL